MIGRSSFPFESTAASSRIDVGEDGARNVETIFRILSEDQVPFTRAGRMAIDCAGGPMPNRPGGSGVG